MNNNQEAEIIKGIGIFLAQSFSLAEYWVKVFGNHLPTIKLASGFFCLILLIYIIYMNWKIISVSSKKEKFIDLIGGANLSKRRVLKGWSQVQKRLMNKDEANLKMAIIEADKILEEILKMAGYKGMSMAERLEQITPAQLSNIEEIWYAHKIRNRIVHEPDYQVSLSETEKIISFYKKAFQEWNLIE